MAEFTMPVLGADMDEGTLLEWLVKPGDEVRKGEVIAVVDTAKSAIDVESFHTGTIERLVTPAGDTVPVGTVLAVIREATPGAGAAGLEFAVAPAAGQPVKPAGGRPIAAVTQTPARRMPNATPVVRHAAAELGVDLATLRGSGRGGAITRSDVERAAAGPGRDRVTPLARRVAADLGVDLSAVTGTGPGGVVRADDVRRAVSAGGPARETRQPAAPARETRQPPAPAREARQPHGPETISRRPEKAEAMRHAIARLMSRSKREIPHYYVSNTVDMATALTWLRERNRSAEVSARMVPAALLLRATALAARQVPELNGFWIEDHFVPAPSVHLGVAISLRGGGLITPAIHDAADLPATELMRRLRDLASRARAGRVRGSELTDATITVTNLGDQGVESVTGVIYPPQVALAGFGKITERPWAVGGLLGVRPLIATTLAADHRATDGYTGARFLAVLADLLQQPEEL
jgi:pyruvate dehydrogenase E2 component (dihydrolipoamide acetyltransferase)